MDPKPLQQPLPLLVGGAGERRTMRIAARFADEWNCWGTPDTIAAKCRVLDKRCEEIGRDPTSLTRSAQAVVLLGDDDQWLAARRSEPQAMPTIIGTPAQLGEEVAAYERAHIDELVVPDWTLPAGRETEWLDQFIEVVATPFRR
jgi:alkanesulfonate monooxygenase SsuD/methylene tetrahydromethanopterin reductase-like flavin-dependent oxidoreductase (luciferase family)